MYKYINVLLCETKHKINSMSVRVCECARKWGLVCISLCVASHNNNNTYTCRTIFYFRYQNRSNDVTLFLLCCLVFLLLSLQRISLSLSFPSLFETGIVSTVQRDVKEKIEACLNQTYRRVEMKEKERQQQHQK